jgi:hypothetical protein
LATVDTQVTQPRLFLNVSDSQSIRFIDASEVLNVRYAQFHWAADLNRDGIYDLVTANVSTVSVSRGLKQLDVALFVDAPVITTQPLGGSVTAGSSVTFSTAASGYPAPTYQWQKNGQNISGATGSAFTIASASLADAGTYRVVVTNAAGTSTSFSASLTVLAPPNQTYVAAIGASPLKAPATADFVPGSSFTMEGWIYLPDVSTSASHLMGKTFDPNTDPYQSFALQLWSGNNLVFAQSNGTPGSLVFLNSPTAISARTWTHVAAVVGGGMMKIYVNGVLAASATSPGAPLNQPTVPFALGLAFYPNGDPNNGTFPGYARQVRFWNVARTEAQIFAALGESLPADRAGLVAAWPLDESGGTTARDISGNGRALTVVGGALSATRATVLAAGPFFTASTTTVTDGSLQYVNPKGAMIDFDSDGDLDLIEVQGGPSTIPETRTRVRAFRFQNGAYVDATDTVLGNVTMVAPSRTIVADFNGDGRADVLLAGSGTDANPWPGEQAKLLLQDTTGHLVDVTATNLPQHSTDYTHSCEVGDIDGDGDLDIYIGNLNVGGGAPRVYVNNGQGVFTEASGRLPADIANRTTTYTGCLLTDVNGDGRADLVLGGWAGSVNKNEILLNDGAGTFARPASPLLPAKMFGADGTVVLIVSTDLNGDGKADLVLSTTDHYFHAGLQILLKQNDGTYSDATAASGITWSPNDTEIDRIDAVGLNADGKPDLVVHFASLGGSYTRLFLNRGDATFIDASAAFTRGSVGSSFHSGDVDGDGIIDLVAASSTGVTFYRGLKRIDLALFYDAPAITTQPATQVTVVGNSVTFTAAASGYPAPTYQWQKNGLNISGATSSVFTIASANLADAGTYTVVVTNSAGTVTSNNASLYVVTLAGAPYIATQPSDQTVSVGASATFTTAAGGTIAPTYQWQKGGIPITGATGATLTLANVTTADAGSYVCIATNTSGTATSATATLTVTKVTPTITWPAPAAVTYGTALSALQLSATASVPGTFAYIPAIGVVLGTGSQPLSATFTPTDAANYTAATATQTLTVTKATPAITWFAPVAITYGTALSAAQLSATANAPGTFVYSPASGVVPGAGGQTLGVTFTPTDTVNYTTATGAQTLTVNKAALTARADDKGKVQGTANPALTITYSGFVNGETKTVITEPTISTTATTDSAAGTYPITLTGGSAANYTLTLVNGTLTITSGSYLANLSVRAAMAAGQTLIVGFVVDGGAKPMLVRAAGPVLNRYGLTGVVDPSLTLYNGGTIVAANNNWDASLAATFVTLGAFSFDAASKDAALLQSINGPHTAQATATGAGAILVEAYDAGPNDGRKLVNLSARFQVGTGDNILIAGFVLSGTGTKQVLIRAIGPTLTNYGVPGVLADPQLAVFDVGTSIASNNDWSSSLSTTFTALGAFALNSGSKDAAIVVTLQAGKPYSVQVSGVGGTTGEALVEIYLVP